MKNNLQDIVDAERYDTTLMLQKAKTVLEVFRSPEDYDASDTYGYSPDFGTLLNADVEQVIKIAIETLEKENDI